MTAISRRILANSKVKGERCGGHIHLDETVLLRVSCPLVAAALQPGRLVRGPCPAAQGALVVGQILGSGAGLGQVTSTALAAERSWQRDRVTAPGVTW